MVKNRPRVFHPRDNQPHAGEGGASWPSPGVAHLRGNYKHVLTERYYYTRTRPTRAREHTNGDERERKRAKEREDDRARVYVRTYDKLQSV